MSSLQNQIHEAAHLFLGQRFVNQFSEELTVGAKALYLIITTLIGARTLGEEYVDLRYVNRNGTRFPKLGARAGFILSYVALPFIVTRVARKLNKELFFSSYLRVLDTLTNLHVAVFYFHGLFYSISKRIFGMRYVFGHNKDPKKLARTGNYSALGAIILLQFAVKALLKLNAYSHPEEKEAVAEIGDSFSKVAQLKALKERLEAAGDAIDLADPLQLPYIPETSRGCMLCLSPMVNPLAANCGHMFCWECIVDWVREHPECPLCRQVCLEQNLLPLR